MRRSMTKLRLAVLAGVTALLATAVALPTAQAAAPPTPSGWTPVWIEDFNGAASTAPDPAKWSYDIGGGGWGNSELQYYTNSNRNVAMDGAGNLVITARKESTGLSCWYGACTHTSGRILTSGKFTQKYGRIEARLKVPSGRGLWPAFWMLGDDIGSVGWPNSGEIDIMEILGHETNKTYGTIHGPGYSGAASVGTPYVLPSGNFASDFHTFTVDWAPDSIKWYVDGVHFATKTPADIGGNKWVFDHPFFIILNLAVGGNWPGSPDASTPFPAQYVIDYVATYQASTSQPAPTRSAYTRIEAESFTTQSGTATETTADTGGGQNVGWIGNGDWRAYDNVDFGTGGTGVEARLASGASTTGNVEVRLDSLSNDPVATIPVSNTGGWQTWVTRSAAMANVTGQHRVYLRFASGSAGDFANLNWVTFTRPAGRDAYSTIQAESADQQSGTQNEATADTGGGQNVGWIGNGDWLRYNGVNFGSTPPRQINARVASGAAAGVSGTVEVRLDSPTGPLLGTFSVGNTGGWQTWKTVPGAVSSVTGTRDVYLRFTTGSGQDFMNLNWFSFTR